MKIAFGHMRYTPEVFWSFSLREWQAALKGYQEKEYGIPDEPLNKASLDKLLEMCPDDRPPD